MERYCTETVQVRLQILVRLLYHQKLRTTVEYTFITLAVTLPHYRTGNVNTNALTVCDTTCKQCTRPDIVLRRSNWSIESLWTTVETTVGMDTRSSGTPILVESSPHRCVEELLLLIHNLRDDPVSSSPVRKTLAFQGCLWTCVLP
jgi:hypothetical protein